MKPAKYKYALLRHVMSNIPTYLVSSLASKLGIDRQALALSLWSRVVSMIFANLTHALNLNDVCDVLRHHGGTLSTVRGGPRRPAAMGFPTRIRRGVLNRPRAYFMGRLRA